MRPDSAGSLADIREACSAVRSYLVDQSPEDFAKNPILRAAVERQFMIIGESVVRLRNKDPDLFARIPDGPAIVAFRNILVHAYEVVDVGLLWGNTRAPLSRLLAAVDELIAEADDAGI